MSSVQKRSRHPYHLKKLYAHWRLRVLPIQHTGKKVHHQHTSYPMIAMLLLVAGLIMAPASGIAMADTLTVSAVVYGDPPATAATIDDPTNGKDFTAAPITVTGTCPTDTYVQLYRNNYSSGTALCSNAGTYSVQTDLFTGANELVAHVYNFADQQGPESNHVTVTYTPPVVVPPIQGSDGTPTGETSNPAAPSQPATAAPFVLRNDFHFRGYQVGEQSSWQVVIIGGMAPYSITVDWGDGTTDNFVSKTADTLTLNHTYDAIGPNKGSYDIVVAATDSFGAHTSLQIGALVTDVNATAGSGSGGSTSGGAGNTQGTGSKIFGIQTSKIVAYSWSTFGGVAIATTGFWLGELRQLRLVKLHFRLTKL